MEQSMGAATSTTTPIEQVDDLIRQVADEAGLDVSAQVSEKNQFNFFVCDLNLFDFFSF